MAKPRSRVGRSKSVPSVRQKTVLYPVITREKWPARPSLSEENIRSLEDVGGIAFDADAPLNLQGIADTWTFTITYARAHDQRIFVGVFRKSKRLWKI
jgi:hypothetical protein